MEVKIRVKSHLCPNKRKRLGKNKKEIFEIYCDDDTFTKVLLI